VKDSPADEAGIPVGGVIKSYRADTEDEELRPSAFRSHITDSSEGPITITYEAGGQEKTVEVTPKAGLISDDQDLKAIGVTPELVETVRRPFVEAVVEATVMTYRSTIAIVVGLGNLLRDIAQLDADLSQVAGPVGIVGLVGDAAEFGFSSLLMFTAVISLNLAVINLLPFPALDGGRLVFVAIESITRKPINPVWVARLNTIGFVLLMALMFAVTYSDIAKLI
jgi:regulator of sigma E protease